MGPLKMRKPAGQGELREVEIQNSNGDTSTQKGPSPQARWREAHPVERWSHVAVASAIRRGILVKPSCCENCGEEKPLDCHHEDPRLALDVKFWCRACHVQHHARRRKGGANGQS